MKQWTRHCVSTSFFPPFSKNLLPKRREPAKAKKGAVWVWQKFFESPFLSKMLVECDRLSWTPMAGLCAAQGPHFSSSPGHFNRIFTLSQLIPHLAATNKLIFVVVNANWCTPFVFFLLQWRNGDSCIAWVLAQMGFSFLIFSNFCFQCRQFRDQQYPC